MAKKVKKKKPIAKKYNFLKRSFALPTKKQGIIGAVLLALAGIIAVFTVFASEPVNSGIKPTRQNTGPRYPLTEMSAEQFLSTRTCNKQRISEEVEIRDSKYKGQTFNINDCEVRRIIIAFGNTTPLPLNELPIINIDHSYFPTEFLTGSAAKLTINHSWVDDGASQFKLTNDWMSPSAGPFPLKVMNSVFVDNYITQPAHSEALQTSDDNFATGMEFTNTVFMVRAGPMNNTGVTATINFHGIDAVFDGCYFLWEGAPPVPAWYSAVFMGTNIVVKNSWFEKGAGGYIDTQGYKITSQNNRDVITGNLIEGSSGTSNPSPPPPSTPTTTVTPTTTTTVSPAPVALPATFDFESSQSNWEGQGNVLTSRKTNLGYESSGSLEIKVDPTGQYQDSTRTARAGTLQYGNGIKISAGKEVSARMLVKSASISRQIRCELRFYNGGTILSTREGVLSPATSSWTERTCSATAPANTTNVAVRVFVHDTSYGEIFYVDNVKVVEGALSSPTTTTSPTPTTTTTVSPTPTTTTTVTPPPITDTTVPSAPTNVKASISFDALRFSYYNNLRWSASYDNVGVSRYLIKRNGTQIGTSTATNFQDYNIAPNNYYTYSIYAQDAAGNTSQPGSARLVGRCFLIWCWAE